MDIFTNKKVWKKIVVALLVVILFQFSVPKKSHADDDMPLGGKLLEPVLDLVVFLGDRNNEYFT